MEWRIFQYREVREAKAFAEAGGIAIHVCFLLAADADAPQVFRGRRFAHMFGPDEATLTEAAVSIGCKPSWVQRPGKKVSYLHFDLVGQPLERALKRCAVIRRKTEG